jgi:hypothetical protein
VTTVYIAVVAIVILAVLIPTAIHLIRAHRAAHRLPTITEQEAREHSRPLSYAITALSPINPPTTKPPTEEN